MTALVLMYHAVEAGPAPLCVEPALFEAHLDAIGEAGATALTVPQLATALRAGALPERAVAITFDDGAASVVRTAAPLLAARALPATVYCVAGHLGGTNDWPSARPGGLRLDLAGAAELAACGLELGSHGYAHEPLRAAVSQRELREAREALEQAFARPVTTYAYPYGAVGELDAVRAAYESACTVRLASLSPGDDPWLLPRLDAHYVRRPELLRRALEGRLGPYLAVRRTAARIRRLAVGDYA